MSALQHVASTSLLVSPDLIRVVSGWADHLRAEKARPTVEAYLRGLAIFLHWLRAEGLTPAGASTHDVRRFRDSLRERYSPATVNLRLAAVRSFYDWLLEQGLVPAVPTAGIRGASRKGEVRHKRVELAGSEVLALLASCEATTALSARARRAGRRDRAILSLMAYCALRTIEVQRANVENLDTRDGWAVLWVQGKGRGEADDFAVLPAPADEALRAWLAVRPGGDTGPLFVSLSGPSRGGRLSLTHIRHMVKRRMAQVGIRNGRKTTHSLRHSAITAAIRNGASPLAVQAMARHRSFDTTLAYVHEVGRTADPAELRVSYSTGAEDSGRG